MNLAKHWAANLDDYVIDLAWSPPAEVGTTGSLLAAASAAGKTTLFDSGTGAVRHVLPGHADGTNCLAWCGTGLQARVPPTCPRPHDPVPLATGGQDGCVRFWDTATGREIASAGLGDDWVEHLCWQPWAAAGDPGHTGPAGPAETPLLFAAAGRKLVALRPDGGVAHTFPDAPKTISALAHRPSTPAPSSSSLDPRPSTIDPHPSALLAASCFGHVAAWDTAAFSLRREYTYGNAILALTWSPDGRWLVAGCHDNAVHLWAPTEDLELHMSGYETKLRELSFSHDSRWLATGGGRDACVWDCSGPGPEGREPMLLPHTARVGAVAFQNAHGLLATGDGSGAFTLWSPTRKNPMVAEVTMPAAATRFAWNHDDSLLAVGTEKGHVFVFRTA